MSERSKSIASPENNRRREGPCRILSDGILLLVAVLTLGFLVWNTVVQGAGVSGDPDFWTWSVRLFLLLCIALVPGTALHAADAWRQGLERQALPIERHASSMQERSFRVEGPAQPLIHQCVEELNRQFHRFYAFHRYQAPYLAYYFYAKKGSLSLFGFPLMRVGFLVFFLTCSLSLSRGEPSILRGWEPMVLLMGGVLVLSGLVIPLAISYREIWVRILEENNRLCLTLSCFGCSKGNWVEPFCRSLELTPRLSPDQPIPDRAASPRGEEGR